MLTQAKASQLAAKSSFVAGVPAWRAVRSQRAQMCVRVQTETEEKQIPVVDFTPNTQAASGYVEFDTAGQSNMYPVITKAYEVGSDQDTAGTGSANLAVGAGAAVIAVVVLAVGLGALLQQGGAPVSESVEQSKSLSEYAAAFAAEL